MLRQTSTSKSSWPNWPANNKRYPGAFAPKLESAMIFVSALHGGSHLSMCGGTTVKA
jgi:hypothetical protein